MIIIKLTIIIILILIFFYFIIELYFQMKEIGELFLDE